MRANELYDEAAMTYDELVDYLKKKYGAAQYDYFCNATLKSKNRKVSRTKEGLICHHVKEDEGVNLGNAADQFPPEWQNKENLVYCNLLEHLLLHIKIAVLRAEPLKATRNITLFLLPGFFLICADINELYINGGSKQSWKQRCFEEIKDNYSEYIIFLKGVTQYIANEYKWERGSHYELKPGNILKFSDGDCEILAVSVNKEFVKARAKDGNEVELSILSHPQLTVDDRLDWLEIKMSKGHEEFRDGRIYSGKIYAEIYQEIKNTKSDKVQMVARKLLVDRKEKAECK